MKIFYKHILVFLFLCVMVLGGGKIVSASSTPLFNFTPSSNPSLQCISSLNNVSVKPDSTLPTKNNRISTFALPGMRPAAQISQISIEDADWLPNGHWGVVLKVYGYGRDITTFNGVAIPYIASQGFVEYGTGGDGFYYLYDCGEIIQAGTYEFVSRHISTNFPYKELTFRHAFVFVEKSE